MFVYLLNIIESSLLKVALLLLVLLTFTSACQKKCQAPATEKFKSITDSKWRLVESTDPSLKNLSPTTFLFYSFENNYTGGVFNVKNNLQTDDPALTFIYQIDPDSGEIRIQYAAAVASEQNETQEAEAPATTTADYSYDLGRELNLVDSNKGYQYRFVPYKGIIAADDTCVF